jgi:WD40 repeat protein
LSDVALSGDGRTIAVAGKGGKAQLWSRRPYAPRGSPLSLHAGSGLVALSADGRTLATAGDSGPVQLWNARTLTPLPKPLGTERVAVAGIAFSPDGRTASYVDIGGTLRRWDLRTHRLRVRQLPVDGLIDQFAFSRDGRRLAWAESSAGPSSSVRLWDVRAKARVGRALALGTAAAGLAFSPDGRFLAIAKDNGTILIQDARTGTTLMPPLHARYYITALAVSRDDVLAAAEDDGHRGLVTFWNLRTGAALGEHLHLAGAIYGLAFSSDGRTVVSTSSNGTIAIWDRIFWRNQTELEQRICRLVIGNLTAAEWAQYVSDLGYRRPCAS